MYVNFDHLKKNLHTKLVDAEISYTCKQDQRKIIFLMFFKITLSYCTQYILPLVIKITHMNRVKSFLLLNVGVLVVWGFFCLFLFFWVQLLIGIQTRSCKNTCKKIKKILFYPFDLSWKYYHDGFFFELCSLWIKFACNVPGFV